MVFEDDAEEIEDLPLLPDRRAPHAAHGRDGRIRERDSYGNDPFPPRETRRVLLPKTDSKTARKKIEEAVGEVIQESAAASLGV